MSVRIAEPGFDVGGGVETVAAGGQVRDDEAGRPHTVEVPVQDEGQLVAVDGASSPRPGVGADLGGVDADPADDCVAVWGPPGWGVVDHGDLRPSHPDRR
jgi:hypothetical protein